jgi:proteasome accessory factor A
VAGPLFGVETEYALTVLQPRGKSLETAQACERFLSSAKAKLPHLPRMRSQGLFLPNGSLLYIDYGSHPEMATPEVDNPRDALRYILAGENILSALAEDLAAQYTDVSEVVLTKANVCYSNGFRTTWGSHESYLTHLDPSAFPEQIIPHLVSRIVYTGAGGFNNLCQGLEFTVSPRVHHLLKEISGNSTSDRPLFHIKNEPLSRNGYRRLHILCGESLCSQHATFLRLGTTALVVKTIDDGWRPGDEVKLASPLDAMRTIAKDPECKAVVELANGKSSTAIKLQRHCLGKVKDYLRSGVAPPWAEKVCTEWGDTLDILEQGAPKSVATTLDWAIKYELYQHRARRRGIPWELLPTWNRVLARLHHALSGTEEYRDKSVSLDFVLGKTSPIPGEVRRLTSWIKNKGLTWEGFRAFLALRAELLEVDTRFGQLGEKGIFSSMDRAGVLQHRVPGIDSKSIEEAMVNPPASGRARIRGECVRRFSDSPSFYLCDWQGVYDLLSRRWLDLSDPFETKERWRKISEEEQATLP